MAFRPYRVFFPGKALIYIVNEQQISETQHHSVLSQISFVIAKVAMVVDWWDHWGHTLMMTQVKFCSNWPKVFRGEYPITFFWELK
jgi:hypothetical protein